MVNPAPAAAESTAAFDKRTQDIVRHVQHQLNLSSEKEVLRMLVSLGFERLREILPKSSGHA